MIIFESMIIETHGKSFSTSGMYASCPRCHADGLFVNRPFNRGLLY